MVGERPVERLLAEVALAGQGAGAVQIAPGADDGRVGLRHLGGGDLDRRLEGLALQGEEQRAGLDVVAFAEGAAHQERLDSGAQIDRIDRHRLADVLPARVDVGALHRCHHHRRRRWLALGARLVVPASAGQQREQGQHSQADRGGTRSTAIAVTP